MKYIYSKAEIDRSLPDNVPVRMFFGGILGLLSTVTFICVFLIEDKSDVVSLLIMSAVSAGIGFLLVYYAIRTRNAIRSVRSRAPEDVILSDENNPFYSSRCPRCSVMIDYQKADLAFRLWYIKGYVECPCCHKPIKHDKEKNLFVPHRYPEENAGMTDT